MKNDVFRYSNCPMHRTMAILGSRWKPIVIYALRGGRKVRFGQLHAIIGSISKKVLTTTLRELETDSILLREEFKELPPRVEYTLTEKGISLVPLIKELAEWDNKHYEDKQIVS